jgi:hypothetical protein
MQVSAAKLWVYKLKNRALKILTGKPKKLVVFDYAVLAPSKRQFCLMILCLQAILNTNKRLLDH